MKGVDLPKIDGNISGLKRIGCTVVHVYTAEFADCDAEKLTDPQWMFYSRKPLSFFQVKYPNTVLSHE